MENNFGCSSIHSRKPGLDLCRTLADLEKAGEKTGSGKDFRNVIDRNAVRSGGTGIFIFISGWCCVVCRLYIK